MTCVRSLQLEILDFLATPRSGDFAAFRDHYPRCADCSAEVRAWTELDLELRAQSTQAHPGVDALVRLHTDPAALEPAKRRRLERHVATCDPCRDELRGLAAFTRQGPAVATPRGAALGQRLRGRLRALRGVALHPAFAYGLVGLLALQGLGAWWTSASRHDGAQRLQRVERPQRIAAARESAGSLEERPAPERRLRKEEPLVAVAQALAEADEAAPGDAAFADALRGIEGALAGEELRRAAPPPGVEIPLPAAGLAPGRYRVELRRADAPESSPPLRIYEVDVPEPPR